MREGDDNGGGDYDEDTSEGDDEGDGDEQQATQSSYVTTHF